MPVQIGASAHDFSDPTGFLSDCHRRIEMFMGVLEAVAKDIDRPLTPESKRAVEAALRYFRESAPKHNADEEESLFPRMRNMGGTVIHPALARIEELEKQHRWAATLHEEVERIGQICLSVTRPSQKEVESFRGAVAELAAMYREHIRVEEDEVFPVAARHLSRGEQAEIGKEMTARRSVALKLP
ncbi:MAG: hemerythrin domain-containing protein [Acidobacteriota bacterium]|nr:hemerythrin domain-containing protein [Acidobacteriota bacterium]